MPDSQRYSCLNLKSPEMPAPDHMIWRDVPEVPLVDVVTGQRPSLATSFQMFRDLDRACFFVRFSGEDDGIRSHFTMHDEPLYLEDVVELFIADENRLDRYKELEVSPWDRRFSGKIRYLDGACHLDMSWQAEGWRTRSRFDREKHRMESVWMLPFGVFADPPPLTGSWRFNAFRIDHSEKGRALLAWQHTGEANFHVPDRFGYLDFQR